jgi:hypothetical protein
MASSGILRRVVLVETDVSEELSASIIILHSHRRENLKSYTEKNKLPLFRDET